jgi:antitoxin (DNA-binding transcriptional repressor) of toxin-antitoxin stability system
MNAHVAVDEAMVGLGGLVDRAACGEEIVILKDGVPCVKLVAAAGVGVEWKLADGLKVSFIPDDFDSVDDEIVRMFEWGCG